VSLAIHCVDLDLFLTSFSRHQAQISKSISFAASWVEIFGNFHKFVTFVLISWYPVEKPMTFGCIIYVSSTWKLTSILKYLKKSFSSLNTQLTHVGMRASNQHREQYRCAPGVSSCPPHMLTSFTTLLSQPSQENGIIPRCLINSSNLQT
jgi:hypothetical protein